MPKAKRARVCIDRILPHDIMSPQHVEKGADGRMRAIALAIALWINHSTLHVKFLGGTSQQQAIAREQASWWMEVCNIKFIFDNTPDAEIRIAFDERKGAWSEVGTKAASIRNNEPTMNLGFLNGGTAAHEFGHAIGLAHEHQNPEGGIQWNEDVVIREMARHDWNEETTRHNIFYKYSADQIIGSEFDPDSVMMYFFPAEWTVNGFSTKQNNVLSKMDKEFVASSRMYPKDAPPVMEAVELEVNAKKRTVASIGSFGEEDLFRFIAAKDGRYVIDTRGKTNVVLRLFGPDSQTAMIAEDDDSGYELNARIARNLPAGDYFAQVRHYDREGGRGDYTISVRKM